MSVWTALFLILLIAWLGGFTVCTSPVALYICCWCSQ